MKNTLKLITSIKIKKIITGKKINEITSFEVENKLFEKKLTIFFKKENIKWNVIQSPMFMNSRSEFKEYVDNSKKILMGNFYKITRKKFNILLDGDNKPIGGKWSFDSENRKKLPKEITIPSFPKILETKHTKDLKPLIEKARAAIQKVAVIALLYLKPLNYLIFLLKKNLIYLVTMKML